MFRGFSGHNSWDTYLYGQDIHIPGITATTKNDILYKLFVIDVTKRLPTMSKHPHKLLEFKIFTDLKFSQILRNPMTWSSLSEPSPLHARVLYYYSDLTLSQSIQPMEVRLLMKAALPLAKSPPTASCRSSSTGPRYFGKVQSIIAFCPVSAESLSKPMLNFWQLTPDE